MGVVYFLLLFFIFFLISFITWLCEQFQEMVTPVTLKYVFESMKTVLQ